MKFSSDVIRTFAPTGTLKASINLGNPILAGRDTDTGEPRGISVDLARELARQMELPLELVVFDAAGKSVTAVTEGKADFGFFAIDPKRGETISFSEPYVLIEGFYLVHSDSPIRSNDDVDQPGNRVVVGGGSAYDLYLSRILKQAKIVRAPTSQAVVQEYIDHHMEVAAGVKQQLEADAQHYSNLRLLNERFMLIRQAMGISSKRGHVAAEALHAFVEEMKSTGFVAQSLERHGIHGASVAPSVKTHD